MDKTWYILLWDTGHHTTGLRDSDKSVHLHHCPWICRQHPGMESTLFQTLLDCLHAPFQAVKWWLTTYQSKCGRKTATKKILANTPDTTCCKGVMNHPGKAQFDGSNTSPINESNMYTKLVFCMKVPIDYGTKR